MLQEPMIKKCCRCVPLRVCLQIWAWFKMMADLITLLYIFAGLLMYWMSHEYDSISQYTHIYLFTAILLILIVDLIFVSILIAGVLKKRYSFLRIFFFYSVYMVLAEATLMVLFLFLVFNSSPRDWNGFGLYCVTLFLIGVLWIVVDVCIMITLKSEMIKLGNKEQYDFSRIMNRLEADNRPRGNYVEKIYQEDFTKNTNVEEKYSKLLDCN